MSIHVGSPAITGVYVGSTPVKAVYVGSTLVWQSVKEIVQITLGTGNQARDEFRAALSARGLNYQTVEEIPFEIELVGTGSTRFMFDGCSSLTTVPDLDTSLVTDMWSMFEECSSLTSAPQMDTSSVTDMEAMFSGCASLVSVPDMNTAQVLYMYGMFQGCAALTDGNARLIGRHPDVATGYMIDGSGLTREPFFDTAGNPI